MRYGIVMLAASTLLLGACQPADDDERGDGPPIEESEPGDQVGDNHGPEPTGPDINIDTAGTPPVQGGGEDLDEEQAARYISDDYQIQVAFPRDLTVVNSQAGRLEGADTDTSSDTDSGTDTGDSRQSGRDDETVWKLFADADADGARLLTLAVPDRDGVRFQLGASRSTQALSHCKDAPSGQAEATETSRTIDDIPFRRFEITETGEEGYRTVQSYRATYGEACYAIDLIARGSGEGGDAEKQALDKLQAVLDGIEFTE